MTSELPFDAPADRSPRLVENLPSSVYHADKETLSSTMVKHALVSPAHFQSARYSPPVSSPDRDFGTLVHTCTLEPKTLNETFAVFPGELSSTEGRAFKKANPGRIVISLATLAEGQHLADRVLAAEYKGRAFHKFIEEGLVEPSIYFDDPTTSLPCRIRPDLFHPEITFDLKTTRHSTASAFQRQALELHYDLSAFMYSFGRAVYEANDRPKPFVIVSAETAEPHTVMIRPASHDFLVNGRSKYVHALSMIRGCGLTQYWPGLDGEEELDLHPYQVFKPPVDTPWLKATA